MTQLADQRNEVAHVAGSWPPHVPSDFGPLWSMAEGLEMPVLLVRATRAS